MHRKIQSLYLHKDMRHIHRVANDFRAKLAQVMRERPMRGAGGDPKRPDLENVVKNIEDLIRGFNYLSGKIKSNQAQVNPANNQAAVQAVQALENAGVTITP